jgi:hypothetical protein
MATPTLTVGGDRKVGKSQRRELKPQPLRRLQSLRHGHIRHQVGEFLAAEPAEQIARAD